MMTKQFIISVSLACILFACQQEDPKPQNYGEVTALLNGQPWQAHAAGAETKIAKSEISAALKTVDIVIYSAPTRGLLNGKKLIINKIPKKIGTYTIHKNPLNDVNNLCSASFYVGIDDILVDSWDVLESANPKALNNFVTITSVDTVKSEIEGTFQTTFIIEPRIRKSDPAAPDTLRVTNGVFRSEIRHQR